MGAREDAHYALIEQLYEANGKGDWSTAAGYLTEDFFVTEADTMPFAGVYHGRGALPEVLDMVLAGDPPVRVPLAEMFRFRDGKVCEIKPYYFDPTPIVRAVQQRRQTRSSQVSRGSARHRPRFSLRATGPASFLESGRS